MSGLSVFGGKRNRNKKAEQQARSADKRMNKEYIQYCVNQDRTLQKLEANLHITDDPEEIAIGTLKTACDFYDGDWAGILSVDMELGLWTPVWWYKVGRPDHTQTLLHEFETMESMPSWIRAMNENNIVILPDTSAVKDSLPFEYDVYQRLQANSVLAAPFKPNPVGFLVIRNPKRYINQPGIPSTTGLLFSPN